MNVSLTPALEQLIDSKVKSGLYSSASEVIREGLRLLAEQDELKQKRIEMLNQEIQRGLDQLNAGQVISGEDAYKDLMKKRDHDITSLL